MKIIKWWLLIPIGLIVIGFIGTEINKAYWDAKVRKLCEKDGGVTVYERVLLTHEEYKRNDGSGGLISVMPRSTTKDKHQYAFRRKSIVIHSKNPYVKKTEYITYRKSDKKVLGVWVTYFRRGGDIPIGFHPSSFSCQDLPGFEKNIEKQIFIYQEI